MEEFDIYVAGFFPSRGETPEQGLARIFSIDEQQARGLVRSLPRVIKKRVPSDQVDRYMQALREIGADVELRRSPLAAQKTLTIGVGAAGSSERPLTLPPAENAASAVVPAGRASSQTMVLYAPGTGPARNEDPGAPLAASPRRPQEIVATATGYDPIEPSAPVSQPMAPVERVVEPAPQAPPAPEPASPSSQWAELDLPVRGARISIKPPSAIAAASAPRTSSDDVDLGAGGRPGWMIEDAQHLADAAAPAELAPDETFPVDHSNSHAGAEPENDESADAPTDEPPDEPEPAPASPPRKPSGKPAAQRASRVSATRVSDLSSPALRGRDASRASAYTGDMLRPVQAPPSKAQVWMVRIALRLAVAMVVFGVLTVARSMHLIGGDVDAEADWAEVADSGRVISGDTVAARGGVAMTAREWSASTVNQWANGEKGAVLKLVAKLEAAGAKAVFPSDVTKTGTLSIASELRIELPEDTGARRAIDAVIREFRATRVGLKPGAAPDDDDPFHGERTMFLKITD